MKTLKAKIKWRCVWFASMVTCFDSHVVWVEGSLSRHQRSNSEEEGTACKEGAYLILLALEGVSRD